jgi:hypothetical protein
MLHVASKSRSIHKSSPPRDRLDPVKRICIAQATRIINATPDAVLKSIASAEPDDMLYRLVSTPASIAALKKTDALAQVRLCEQKIASELLAMEGGYVTPPFAAKALRISFDAVDRRRKRGTLLAVDLRGRGFAYPNWQFAKGGDFLNGFVPTLKLLRAHGCSEWRALSFFLNPHIDLNGQTPLNALRAGHLDGVLFAASTEGKMDRGHFS